MGMLKGDTAAFSAAMAIAQAQASLSGPRGYDAATTPDSSVLDLGEAVEVRHMPRSNPPARSPPLALSTTYLRPASAPLPHPPSRTPHPCVEQVH